MNRRSFLTGIVKAAAATELIIQATPQQVAAFGSGDKVGVIAEEPISFGFVRVGEMLFNKDQRPVCIVQRLEMNQEMQDVTTARDPYRQMMPYGAPEIVITGIAGRDIAAIWKARQYEL